MDSVRKLCVASQTCSTAASLNSLIESSSFLENPLTSPVLELNFCHCSSPSSSPTVLKEEEMKLKFGSSILRCVCDIVTRSISGWRIQHFGIHQWTSIVPIQRLLGLVKDKGPDFQRRWDPTDFHGSNRGCLLLWEARGSMLSVWAEETLIKWLWLGLDERALLVCHYHLPSCRPREAMSIDALWGCTSVAEGRIWCLGLNSSSTGCGTEEGTNVAFGSLFTRGDRNFSVQRGYFVPKCFFDLGGGEIVPDIIMCFHQ